MPKKIIDDSDSSSESEPEQYEEENVEPKVKITKLEKARSAFRNPKEGFDKPKRVMSEKQLENLKRGRENRVKARQEKQLQEKQLQETTAPEPVEVAAVEPTREPATVIIKEVKKPLSKLNKKQLKIEADLLKIDINNLTNAEIIKKIRESQGKQDTSKIDTPKFEKAQGAFRNPKEGFVTPKKKISVKQTVKEIHHHHYKKEDDPKIQEKAQGAFNKPSVTIKKESKIINFV